MNRDRFAPFAWGVFAYALLVIQWGYFLRVSESGDGCGTDWPLCRGEVLPREAELSTLVELTHRLSSGVVLILACIMAVWAFRVFPRRHLARAGAAAVLLFTLSESLFGAVLVVFGWVATDVSAARIAIRPFHVTNTFLLIGALTLTPWWARLGEEEGAVRPALRAIPLRGPAVRLLAPALLGILALAWTGAWTGLATTAFPAGTLREGAGQYLDPEHLLIWLRLTHPVLAVAVVALLLRVAGRLHARYRAAHRAKPLAAALGALAVVQLLVGALSVLLANPVWSRLLHLLLADLLWIAAVLALAVALRDEKQRGAGGARRGPPPGARSALHERGAALDPAHEGRQ